MISKFPKVKQYYSFESNVYGRPYKLFEVEDTIVEKFHNLLEKLDNQPQTILCTRGDSKLDSDTDEHNNFFDEELSKVFIVGTKARYNQHSENQEIYDHTTVNHKINLLHELKQLINLTNEAMNTRGIENSEEELEYFNSSFFEKLSTLEMETLEKWKIFFLSFHHTDGRLQEFNSNSPFLSMTYGVKKFSNARHFALGSTRENGFVYLYSLNSGDPYYLKTSNLTKELKGYGAKWHYDKFNEIVLINGMFPHYMLGIFEVKKYSTPRFIINPWLYDILESNEPFNYEDGLKIDQRNFKELARDLGYSNFFISDENNEAYIANINGDSVRRVIVP